MLQAIPIFTPDGFKSCRFLGGELAISRGNWPDWLCEYRHHTSYKIGEMNAFVGDVVN